MVPFLKFQDTTDYDILASGPQQYSSQQINLQIFKMIQDGGNDFKTFYKAQTDSQQINLQIFKMITDRGNDFKDLQSNAA